MPTWHGNANASVKSNYKKLSYRWQTARRILAKLVLMPSRLGYSTEFKQPVALYINITEHNLITPG